VLTAELRRHYYIFVSDDVLQYLKLWVPVGFWIVKRRHQSKVPYILAIIGSAALIVFYIATRIVSIPTIGLQTDVGSIDIAVKVLQSAIIVGSLFALGLPKKFTNIAG
jgi:hypothetical protein